MKFLIVAVCFVSTFLHIDAAGSGTFVEREKLRKQLFKDYDPMVLPENVTLKFGIAIINLDLDIEKNIVDTLVWNRYSWNDERFSWDEEANGVDVLRVGSDEVWKPDFVLYNTANTENLIPCGQINVLIYPSGQVLWVPPCNYRSMCDLSDLIDNPKKAIDCKLTFGSWTLDGYSMDLQFYRNISSVDMTDFKGSSDWKIVSNSAERIIKIYDCCPEPYQTLEYKLFIQKKSAENTKCSA